MAKSPDAFRTISEVAGWLDTPAHVLRFWESKFAQIKPVKRAGGRRYYRPEDMALLGGIKRLLHDDGMTIKGVQKLLREKGVRHVAALGPDPGEGVPSVADLPGADLPEAAPPEAPPPPSGVSPELWPEDDPWPADPVFRTQDVEEPAESAAAEPQGAASPSAHPAAPRPPYPADPPRPETGLVSLALAADPRRVRANAIQIRACLSRLEALRERIAEGRF